MMPFHLLYKKQLNQHIPQSVGTNGKRNHIPAIVHDAAVEKINSGSKGLYFMQIPQKKVRSFLKKKTLSFKGKLPSLV